MDKKPLEIILIHDAGQQDTWVNLQSDLDGEIWKFGVPTPTYGWDVEDTRNLWWSDMIKNRWHETLFQDIQDKMDEIAPHTKNYIFKLINAQAGGRTHGLDGSIHVDHEFQFNENGDGFMTFCYFPHTEWDPQWGGDIQFFDPETGQIIATFAPMPNTCIAFDSNIPHRGYAPTKECSQLRKYISIKTQVSNHC
jgi:hypothetical protein